MENLGSSDFLLSTFPPLPHSLAYPMDLCFQWLPWWFSSILHSELLGRNLSGFHKKFGLLIYCNKTLLAIFLLLKPRIVRKKVFKITLMYVFHMSAISTQLGSILHLNCGMNSRRGKNGNASDCLVQPTRMAENVWFCTRYCCREENRSFSPYFSFFLTFIFYIN